jgi:hypothetical protein
LARERGAATLTAVDLEAVRARGREAMREAQGREVPPAHEAPPGGRGADDRQQDDQPGPDRGRERQEG